MKKLKVNILFIAAITIACFSQSCAHKPDPEKEKSDVTSIIRSFYQSFEQEDMDLMSEVMAHDDSMLSFGTSLADLHEGWTEWKQNHLAQFEAIDKAKLNSKNLHVYLSQTGDVAWFADVTDWSLVVQGEMFLMKDIRITGVLEKRKDHWKIVQIHASVPQE